MSQMKFEELNLSKELLKAIDDMGFEEATPIQAQTIPYIYKGKDVIGQAQTGTGKTAAFGLPILDMINSRDKSQQAIILCPTRELAIQVAGELKALSKYK
ncbi:MAG: DEAD/DEAH box helicase, partial [Tepidanaerobacteraceae bacterium]